MDTSSFVPVKATIPTIKWISLTEAAPMLGGYTRESIRQFVIYSTLLSDGSRADEPRLARNGHHDGNGRPAKPISQVDWADLNAEFVANVTDADAVDLAGVLRLPVEFPGELEFGVEWIGETRLFTFPEKDGHGIIVGITRRYSDGTKRMVPGSRRGLSIPTEFRDRAGPVLVVEGASDTLALSGCGLAAVGRPRNVGGVEHLAELLAGIDRGRDIVVVGENDKKPDGKWPG